MACLLKIWLVAIAFLLISHAAWADLPVALVNENRLPYNFSPSNYDNSASNYDNSISNYDNSASNYDNSESNYDNSASNNDNSRSGERRLIFQENGVTNFAGYYLSAGNGTTNFFSPRGKRIFYNPKKGRGIFSGKDGMFCGVLANIGGKMSLALTEQGAKILYLTE